MNRKYALSCETILWNIEVLARDDFRVTDQDVELVMKESRNIKLQRKV